MAHIQLKVCFAYQICGNAFPGGVLASKFVKVFPLKALPQYLHMHTFYPFPLQGHTRSCMCVVHYLSKYILCFNQLFVRSVSCD